MSALELRPVDLGPALLALVQRRFSASLAAPRSHVHDQHAASWRLHVAAYVARVAMEWSREATAALIGKSMPLVTYAVRQVEDAREDADFDEAIEGLCREAEELKGR